MKNLLKSVVLTIALLLPFAAFAEEPENGATADAVVNEITTEEGAPAVEAEATKVAEPTVGKVISEKENAPAEWVVSAEDKGDGLFAITFEATIIDGYHGYTMGHEYSAPQFEFDGDIKIVGDVVEPLPAEEIIDDFGYTELVYYNKATYIFTIKANYGQRVIGYISATIGANEANLIMCRFADFKIIMPRRVR